MSCNNAYFNSWSACQSLLKRMNGGFLQIKGGTWTDTTAVDLATWHTAISSVTTANRLLLPLPILSFENTTDAPEILTAPFGKKSKGNNPIPSGIVYLDASLCDYKYLHDLENIKYEFIPTFEDGTMWMSRKAAGTLKGFRCDVATVAGLPPSDANQSYPLHIFFDNYSEFKNVVVISDQQFSFNDLMDYMPVALDMRITTAMNAGVVNVLVTVRGTDEGKTGLAAADFEVMKSNATPTVVVTAVTDSGLGNYAVTIKKDNDGTPANMAAGDYAYLQASDDDSTYVTYLSNSIKVSA
jgi:hypothetical protein